MHYVIFLSFFSLPCFIHKNDYLCVSSVPALMCQIFAGGFFLLFGDRVFVCVCGVCCCCCFVCLFALLCFALTIDFINMYALSIAAVDYDDFVFCFC